MSYDAELAVARRFLEATPLDGAVVFCALSGAHLYGFPSPDSDLDLKGVYEAPAERFLGLPYEPPARDVTAWSEGLENDLTLLELRKSLSLLLAGNGNTLEQIFSPLQVAPAPALDELRALAGGALSKRFGRHYRGFLRRKRLEFEAAAAPSVKTLLYGYRVAATGAHLLHTGEVVAHLPTLAPGCGFDLVPELIARKREGEHTALSVAEKARLAPEWDRMERALVDAYVASALPEDAQNTPAVDAWLVRRRRSSLLGDVAKERP